MQKQPLVIDHLSVNDTQLAWRLVPKQVMPSVKFIRALHVHISSGMLISPQKEVLHGPGVAQLFLASASKELDGALNEHLLEQI